MKPFYNDDFSKLLIERSLAGMSGQASYGMLNEEKCNHTGKGVACPSHGMDDCSDANDINSIRNEAKNAEGKEQGADGKACWKGYKYAGTENGKDKCVKAGYEMEGEEEIVEKAPPGAKYERMVKHIKKGYSKGGLSDKEKSIAYATAWKAKNKAVKEEKEDESEAEEEKEKKMSKSAKEKHEKAEEKKEKEMKEARNLPGNQEKIDANKNGKVDAHDFALLRARKGKKTVKEMIELALEGKKPEIEIMPEIDDSDPANIKASKKKKEKEKGNVKEEKMIEQLKKHYQSFKTKYSYLDK